MSSGKLEALVGLLVSVGILSIILFIGQIVYQMEVWYENNKDTVSRQWIKDKLSSTFRKLADKVKKRGTKDDF